MVYSVVELSHGVQRVKKPTTTLPDMSLAKDPVKVMEIVQKKGKAKLIGEEKEKEDL